MEYPPGDLMLSPQYVAGFFDGEGSVILSFAKRSRSKLDPSKVTCTFNFTISISNTNLDVLERLKEKYSGKITAHSLHEKRKLAWQWRIYKPKNQEIFLLDIRPFSILKRRHIEIGLEYLKTLTKQGCSLSQDSWDKRISAHAELWELNSRGTTARLPKHQIPPTVRKKFNPKNFYDEETLKVKMKKMREARSHEKMGGRKPIENPSLVTLQVREWRRRKRLQSPNS